MNKLQKQFRTQIPLFYDLPLDLFQSLDLSHFSLPTAEIEMTRARLEKTLGHYVVTYQAHVFRLDIPVETHLCALVKGANLNPAELNLLAEYERMLQIFGVTLVVFQKPLTLMNITQSAVYQEYKRLNLL